MEDTTTQTTVNQVAEASSQPASSASEPNTSDAAFEAIVAQQHAPAAEPVAEPVVEAPAPTAPEPEPERQPRPAQRRIQELVQQNKQLREQLVNVPIPPAPPQAPKLSELVQGREQLMPEELDQLGQQVYQQGAQAAKGTSGLEVAQLRQEMIMRDAINETDKTASQLPLEYKELNPNEPSLFNPALERKIVERYQKEAVRPDPATGRLVFDPSVKLADVARDEVEFYREATEYGKAQTTASLATLADHAAVTPTSATPAPDKSFDNMSLSEQEAYLRAQGHDI